MLDPPAYICGRERLLSPQAGGGGTSRGGDLGTAFDRTPRVRSLHLRAVAHTTSKVLSFPMPRKKSVESQFRQEREAGWDATTSNFSLNEYNSMTDRVRVQATRVPFP